MQSVSGTLAAAITAAGERPRHVVRLLVDWQRDGSFAGTYDDLSADVESVSLSRELATDLPPQVKLFAGAASAQATITLAHRDPAGNPDQHGAWFYSGLNPASPLYGFSRKGAPVRLEVGFVTDAGPEYVRVLTGTVRALNVNSGGRTATLQVADGSESMRRQVAIPVIVAEGRTETGTIIAPDLYASFLVDWIFRACGYYASPPRRTGCKFMATFNGSAWPEVGRLVELVGVAGEPPGFKPTAAFPDDPPFIMAMGTSTSGNPVVRYNLGGSGTVSANSGRTILVEGWFQFRTTAIDQPLWQVFRGGGSGTYLSVFWQTSTGRLTVTCNRGSQDANTGRAVQGPIISPGTDWHYYGIHVTFNATNFAVTFRYDSTTTGPTTSATTATVNASESWDSILLDQGKVSSFATGGNSLFMSSVQVTTEASAGSWNDAFTPTAVVEVSKNRLLATPNVTEEGWTLLQQLAEAELATAGFDEQGVPYFSTRDRFDRGAYLTVQRTLTATNALMELESTEAIDQIRNRVIIRADTPNVLDAAEVWRMSWLGGIGGGDTSIIWAEFNDPVTNLDLTVTYSGDPTVGSRYLAGTNRDGSGSQISNLAITVTPFATSAQISIHNPNSFPAWLCVDANAASQFFGTVTGNPYLVLNGQAVSFGGDTASGQRVEATDATSIAAYEEQLLELDATPFRQHLESLQALADDMLFVLKDAGPALLDIPIPADPRLQLADRVAIQDPTGLAVDAEFHLSKINLEVGGGGMTQTLSLRAARTVDYFDVGNYDEGDYDEGSYD